jgi:hypothetical protein
MKGLERYSVEELHEELCRFTFLENKRNYEINYKEYREFLEAHPNFPIMMRMDDIALSAKDYHVLYEKLYILLIHMLEIPLEEVPLYVNSAFNEVKVFSLFRLEKGR